MPQPARRQSPRVSVVIPTWNRAQLLTAAVDSVLAQTMPSLEVLVCDDGSTDGTAAVLERLTAGDSRVRVVRLEHSGLAAIPRNAGIHAAWGEWVAFLDSDDRWHETKLERQLAVAAAEGADALATGAWRVAEAQTPGSARRLMASSPGRLTLEELIGRNVLVTSTVLIRRTLLERTGDFPARSVMRVGEDYALWLRVATFSPWYVLGEPLVFYRDDPASSIRGIERSDEAERLLHVFADYVAWRDATDSPTPETIARLCLRRLHTEALKGIVRRAIAR